MTNLKRMAAYLFFLFCVPAALAAEEPNPFLKLCRDRLSELEGCKKGRSEAQQRGIDNLSALVEISDYMEKRKFLEKVAKHRKAEAENNVKTIRKFIACLNTNPDLLKVTVPKGCDKETFTKLRKMARDTALNLPVMQRAAVMRNSMASAKPYKFNKYFEETAKHNFAGLNDSEKEKLLAEIRKDLPYSAGDELPGPANPFLGNVKTQVMANDALLDTAARQLIQDMRAVKLEILKRTKVKEDLDYSAVYEENSGLDTAWASQWHDPDTKKAVFRREESGAYVRELNPVATFYNSQYEAILGAHPYFLYMPAYTSREKLPEVMAVGLEAMLKNHAEDALKVIEADLAAGPGVVNDGLLKYITETSSVEAVLKEDLAKQAYPVSCQLAEEFLKAKDSKGKLIGAAFRIGGWTCFIGTIASMGATAYPCMVLGYVGLAYGGVNTVLSYGELKERADKAYSALSPKDKKEIEKLIAANKLQSLNTSLFLIENIAGQLGISMGALVEKLNISGLVSQITSILSIGAGMPKQFMDQLVTDYIHSQIFKARNEALKGVAVGEGTELGAMADTYTRSQQIKDVLATRLDFKSSSFDKEGFCSSVKNTLNYSRDLDKDSRNLVESSAVKYGCKL